MRRISAERQARMELSVSVPFATVRQAEIAHNSLRVEVEPSRSRVTRRLAVEGSSLVAQFSAAEPRSLRVAVNSYFEHVILIIETIRNFG